MSSTFFFNLSYIYQKPYSEALSKEKGEFNAVKTRIRNHQVLCDQIESSLKYVESQIHNLETQIKIKSTFQEGLYLIGIFKTKS